MLILLLVASIVAGIFYRMGGADGFNTKYRDVGVSLVSSCVCGIWFGWSPWLILHFFLLFAALTTYWDTLFNYDNFWFHGFMCGLAAFPIAIYTGHWFSFWLRAIMLGLFVGHWSLVIKNDVLEEGGRGFLIVITLPILCL